MRPLLLALSFALLVSLSSPASALPVDLLDVDVDQGPEPAPCVLGIDLACFVWHDPGEDDGIGDDTYYTFQDIERIRSRVATPLQEHLDGFADLDDGIVQVPICDTYNMVDEPLDRTLGPTVTDLVDVDMDEEGIKPRYPVYDPETGTWEPFTPTWLWDENFVTCDCVHIPYTTYPRDTDYVIDGVAAFFGGCHAEWLVGPPGCEVFRLLYETLLGLKDVLPNINFGAEVDEWEGGTTPHPAAPTEAHLRHDGVGGRSSEHPATSVGAAALPDDPLTWERATPLPVLQPVAASTQSSHERGPVLRDAADAGRLVRGAAFAAEALVLAALPVLAWWLYHRITGQRALEHPTRRAVHRFVQAHPGCDVAMIAAAHGLSYKTALHHVEVLKRGGFVRVRRDGRRFRVAVPRGGAVAAHAALLRHPTRALIVARVQAQPGLRQADLARELAVTRSTMHGHVVALERAGLVRNAGGRLHAVEATVTPPAASTPGLQSPSAPAAASAR